MKFLFSAIFFITTCAAFSQRFGGNPPSIKWNQINNPATRVIFPRGLDSVAQQVAGIVQQLNTSTQQSIGNKLHKIDIVLHNQTTFSNAYVGLGPYRSEFYLMPPQNSFTLGSLPWPEQLAIHEFRHVQQNNNFNVGLSKVLRIVFGEEGQALANSLVIPDWFYEGDAVYNETNVSRQGRGRLPFFYNDYRSLWQAGKNYKWMKLRNGSFKDFTPDHYRLGYMMVAYGREQYGNEFWRKVTQDAASYKGVFYPFQKAVKNNSGKNYTVFRKEVLNYFRKLNDTAKMTMDKPSKAHRHFVADEEYPAIVDDSTVILMKTTYKQIPAFIIRTNNKDKKLRVRDYSLDNQFSYRNGNIVYASYRPDLRWGWKDYSELKVIDIHTGKQRSLTKHSKYFSPDISNDGSTIIAVNVDSKGNSELQFLDAGNGTLIKAVPNPEKLFYTNLKFYNARDIITAVKNTAGQMSLALIDGVKGIASYLTPFSFNVIGFPVIQNDTVYFSASYNSTDLIFAYSLAEKKLFRLASGTSSNLGNYQPAVGSDKLWWSNFTAFGYQLQSANKKEVVWESMPETAFNSPLPDFGITSINKNPAGTFASSKLPVTKYPASYRLLNFHSLQPLLNDPVYSLSLVGENVLNTLQSELFFSYNRNEKSKKLGFNTTYGALFPYLSAGASYTFDRRSLYHGKRIYWNEGEFRGGFELPFNLNKGRNFTGLNIGADYVFNQPNFKGVYKDSLGNQSFGYVNTYVSFYNQVQQAKQHIYPRLAQSLLINYKRAVSNFDANQFLISGYLYLPGLFVNHNLVLNAAFQQKDTLNQRSFSNNFPFSRGYSAENFHLMTKWGVNYHFPITYPDAGFGNIIYLLRLRANVFYDNTYVEDSRKHTASFRSTGAEIFFDTKWWNQLPLSIGFRYSYLLDKDLFGGSGSSRFEFVLPVNLLQR
jgi:hypothetical protein